MSDPEDTHVYEDIFTGPYSSYTCYACGSLVEILDSQMARAVKQYGEDKVKPVCDAKCQKDAQEHQQYASDAK